MPRVTLLSNGVRMPVATFGTYTSSAENMEEAVLTALRCGYRHLDCAAMYRNEDEVGRGIQTFLKESPQVKRSDLFVTTKLLPTEYHPSNVEKSLQRQLNLLQLSHVDLYLLHWPVGMKLRNSNSQSMDNAVFDPTTNIHETWKAMETLVHHKLTKSIGVSNFNSSQLTDLCSHATIRPVVNQIELHPLLPQDELAEIHKRLDIITASYRVLGWRDATTKPQIVSDLEQIATDANCSSSSELCLAWNAQRGNVVLCKSTNSNRISQNLKAINDTELTEDIMERIHQFYKKWGEFRAINPPWGPKGSYIFP